MRLSLRTALIAVGTALACLTPVAAAPAYAQEQPPAVVCDQEVCETLLAVTPTLLEVEVELIQTDRCGKFIVKMRTSDGLTETFTSQRTCHPTWISDINRPSGSGTLQARFESDPPTPGEPIIPF